MNNGTLINAATTMPSIAGDDGQIMAFAATGNLIACRWGDNTVIVYDVFHQKELAKIDIGRDTTIQSMDLCGAESTQVVVGFSSSTKRAFGVDVYDAMSGKLTTRFDGRSYNLSGDTFGCSVAAPVVFWLNQRGQLVASNVLEKLQLWISAATDIDADSKIKISADGSCFVTGLTDGVSCNSHDGKEVWTGGTISCQSREGRQLWSIPMPTGNIGSDCQISIPPQALEGDTFIYRTQGELVAVRMQDGAKIWGFPLEHGVLVRAIAPDGKVVLAANNTDVNIIEMSTGKSVKADMDVGSDVCFGDNGKRLFVLSGLRQAAFDEKNNSIKMVRESNRLKVLDVRTGQLEIQMDLKRD